MSDQQEPTKGDMFFAVMLLAVIGVGIWFWVDGTFTDGVVVTVLGFMLLGLAKFGFDAATAVEKKAKE